MRQADNGEVLASPNQQISKLSGGELAVYAAVHRHAHKHRRAQIRIRDGSAQLCPTRAGGAVVCGEGIADSANAQPGVGELRGTGERLAGTGVRLSAFEYAII